MREKTVILFVDDDQYEMAPLVEALQDDETFDVHIATDPITAKAQLDDQLRPDLLITDLRMRTTMQQTSKEAAAAGVALAKHVRDKQAGSVTIIVLTAVGDDEIVEQAERVAAVVLRKPIGPQVFLRRVKEALR